MRREQPLREPTFSCDRGFGTGTSAIEGRVMIGMRSPMLRLLIAALTIASVGHRTIGHEIAVAHAKPAGSGVEDPSVPCCPASDAKSIRDRVALLLNDLATNACGDGVSFAERVDKTALTLAALRKFIRTSRSMTPYLGEEDTIFLSSVENSIDESKWFPWGKLTGKVVLQFEIDLAEQFSLHYAVEYAIGDDGKLALDDFRHDWAKKLFSGLSCLRIPEGYR